jgi:hypothetical protein
MLRFLREGKQRVINQDGLRQQNLIREALFAMADKLMGQELKLADYLRVLELREDTGEQCLLPLRTGWVRGCQSDHEDTDG